MQPYTFNTASPPVSSPFGQILTLDINHSGIYGTMWDHHLIRLHEQHVRYTDVVHPDDDETRGPIAHEGVNGQTVIWTLELLLDAFAINVPLEGIKIITTTIPALSTTLEVGADLERENFEQQSGSVDISPTSSSQSTSSSSMTLHSYVDDADMYLRKSLEAAVLDHNNTNDNYSSRRVRLSEFLHRILTHGPPYSAGYEHPNPTWSTTIARDDRSSTLGRYWCDKWDMDYPVVMNVHPTSACLTTQQTTFATLSITDHVDTLLVLLYTPTAIEAARKSGAHIFPGEEGWKGIWEDLITPKIRLRMRDKYTNGKWSQLDQLIGLMPPGGSLGVDDKSFSFIPDYTAIQPSAHVWARDGLIRFEGGMCVHKYRDPRAEPRCLLESQMFRLKGILDSLNTRLDGVILVQNGQVGSHAQRVVSQIMRLPLHHPQDKRQDGILNVHLSAAHRALSYLDTLTQGSYQVSHQEDDCRQFEWTHNRNIAQIGLLTPPHSRPSTVHSSPRPLSTRLCEKPVTTTTTAIRPQIRTQDLKSFGGIDGLYTPSASTADSGRSSAVDLSAMRRGFAELHMTPLESPLVPSQVVSAGDDESDESMSRGMTAEGEEGSVREMIFDERGSWEEEIYLGLGSEHSRLKYLVVHHLLLPPCPPSPPKAKPPSPAVTLQPVRGVPLPKARPSPLRAVLV